MSDTVSDSGRPPRPQRLARRLLLANGLVIAAGAVTLAVVALLVSPPLFQRHVVGSLGPVSDAVAGHLDAALSTTLLLSLGVATVASACAALAVSWVLSSRLARPIEELSDVAGDVARGDLTARAVAPPVDDELADLIATFNAMAAALEHSEDARRRLLADLAHELRTPLSTLEGYLEGLQDGVVEPDDQTWATLQEATSRLRRLVRDVDLVSRTEELGLDIHPQSTDPADLVAAAAGAARDAYERSGVTLEHRVEDGLGPIEVDPDRAHQVLANLLDNARRHTPRGGRVQLEARRTTDGVVLAVQDDGSGIAPEHLAHVFDRFYRADASRQAGTGSGIGLTIARAIARAHHGELTVASAGPGHGSRFEWHLPH